MLFAPYVVVACAFFSLAPSHLFFFHFKLTHCSWWLSSKSHQCLLIVHFFLYLFVSHPCAQFSAISMRAMHFFFKWIFLLFKGGIHTKEENNNSNWMNYSRLHQATSWRIDDRREWWASISENNAYTLSEWRRAQLTNENIKKHKHIETKCF